MSGQRVEYATSLEVALKDARTEVTFRPLSREDFSAILAMIWQWGKSGRFIFAISQGGSDPEVSAPCNLPSVAPPADRPTVSSVTVVGLR